MLAPERDAAADASELRETRAPSVYAADEGELVLRDEMQNRMAWVKTKLWPPWPALVADPSVDAVPPCTQRQPKDKVAVRFFGDGLWQFVNKKMCLDFEAHYEQHATAPRALACEGFKDAVAAANDMLAKRKRLEAQRSGAAGVERPDVGDVATGSGDVRATTTPAAQQAQPPQPPPPATPVTAAQQLPPGLAEAVQAASPAVAPAESREVALLRLHLKRKQADVERLAAEEARHAAAAARYASTGECIDIQIKLARLA